MSGISSVLDTIRKLQALAKSSNVNEAAAAAGRADYLIGKHRISQQELEDADATLSSAENPMQDDRVLYATARVTMWKETLARMLATQYGCGCYSDRMVGNRETHFKLVGRKSDMDVVHYMFAWLSMEFESLAKRNATGLGHAYSQSYYRGCVDGVRAQLLLEKQKLRQEYVGSTALMKIDSRTQESTTAMYNMVKGLKKITKHSHAQFSSHGYNNGKAAGSNIHLGKSMGGKSGALLGK